MPLKLFIVAPRGTVIDESVDDVVAPGTEGEFGVLPGHAPFLAATREGVVRYQSGGRPHYLAVSTGFAEVAGDHVVLLARTAEKVEDIDRERAEAALARARARTGGDLTAEEIARVESAAARATARLSLLSR